MTGRSFIGVALVLGAFVGALAGLYIGSLWIGIGGGVVLGTVIGVLLDAGDKARSNRGGDGSDGGGGD